MAHHHRPHPGTSSGLIEPGATIDDLIRPGLRQAFPLPEDGYGSDERFRRLLDALAQRRSDPQQRGPQARR